MLWRGPAAAAAAADDDDDDDDDGCGTDAAPSRYIRCVCMAPA
jgi:hypothetical protein